MLGKHEVAGPNPVGGLLNFSDSVCKRNDGFSLQTFRRESMNLEKLSLWALALSASSLSMNKQTPLLCVIMRIVTNKKISKSWFYLDDGILISSNHLFLVATYNIAI